MSAEGRSWGLILGLLALGLAGTIWLALGIGVGRAGFGDLGRITSQDLDPWTRAILLDVRLPRVLLAALVGAALSGAGVAFQATLRNPLSDPYILGVSGGAALGAVAFTAMAGGSRVWSPLGRPAAAFAGAMLSVVVLFALARIRGRTETTALLLVGVIINAIDSALILFLVTAGDTSRFQGALFYLVGSIGSPPWSVIASIAGLTVAGLAGLTLLSHRLNLLSFGEETAGHLGVNVEAVLWTAVVSASLITAASVAFVGLVGFVGLIVPHAVRAAFGPDHRLLVPASALAGGSFLVLADTLARVMFAPVELPVGVITALLGGPFFLYLFMKRLREGG